MSQEGRSITKDLRDRLGSDKVLSDPSSLRAYAIDASIHKVTPQAIVLIESLQDLKEVVQYANQSHIPLTARSGGTNLVGNAIGSGIILEFSRLNQILEFKPEKKQIRLQPGIIYAELDRYLAPSGLRFAPDPSSGEMCKLGGMIGNNAAGPHTLKYGATKDHVLSMELLLADGTPFTAKQFSLDSREFETIKKQFAWIEPLIRLVRDHSDLLKEKKPRVSKNSSGYNLLALAEGLDRGILDLPRLFVGSEGTLGLLLEATLNLIPRPIRTVTALIHLEQFSEVGQAVRSLLSLQPGALELLDSNSLNLIGRSRFGIPESTQAVLLIELDEEPLEEKIALLHLITNEFKTTKPVDLAHEIEQQEALWGVRKAIYPMLYRYGDPDKKPINFADDVVVSVERLPDLVEYLNNLFHGLNVPVVIYGHVGDGNVHINPLLDVNHPGDFEKMIQIAQSIHQTVIERFEGSICGEHGDGRVRGEFVKALYGEAVYDLFWKVKKLLDPEGILNPEVKLTDQPFSTTIDFERLSKDCATCGRCNTVCPVYDVRQEESNGARGWFHILTDPDYSYEKASRVVEACLNCKACSVVCPAGIDVSSIILEKRAEHPNQLAGFFFKIHANPRLFEPLIRVLGRTQFLWDHPLPRLLLDWMTRPLLKQIAPTARIPKEIALPRFASRTLRERFSALTEESGHQASTAYFHGCAANYFMDGVGDSVIRVLKRNGINMVMPRQRCSGTPVETYGQQSLVKDHARFNMKSLNRYDKVVTSCASCTFMLKSYPRFFEGDSRQEAEALSQKVVHITDFLVDEINPTWKSGSDSSETVTYHASCHLRAAGGGNAPQELLKRLPGNRYRPMEDSGRCAGGAGTFLVKDWQLSRQIFERKRRGILASGAKTVATSCPACMIQLKTGLEANISVKHVIQLIDEAEAASIDDAVSSKKSLR